MGRVAYLPTLICIQHSPYAADSNKFQLLLHRQQHTAHGFEIMAVDNLPVLHEYVPEHEVPVGRHYTIREKPRDHIGHEQALDIGEVILW